MCVHGNEGTCHPVQQCDSLMGFKSFWTTMEFYDIRYITQYLLVDQFIVGLGLHMGFADSKKNTEYIHIDLSLNYLLLLYYFSLRYCGVQIWNAKVQMIFF